MLFLDIFFLLYYKIVVHLHFNMHISYANNNIFCKRLACGLTCRGGVTGRIHNNKKNQWTRTQLQDLFS